MKKILLSAVILAFGFTANAQLPVSTTAENKNVVLEEFTGIYCTFCPDGHSIANSIKAANPNDVVLINIHEGFYAVPSGNDPDFRTPFGTAIAGQTNLAGYPAGTVNRHEFPGLQQNGTGTAMSRGNWSNASTQTLAQASYVNAALEADIDVQTRIITVDVELHFTGSTAPASVNLNVALMQNNVEGPQTGSAANPSQVLPNGNYLHNHMLRHLLTGQWGEVISTTSMGTTVTRQYTYTIPADLNGVPYELGDLEIAAFVVEGQQEIITGANGPMSFTVPAGVNLVDLSSATNMTIPTDYCGTSITPEITVTNASAIAADTFAVSYSLNGGTPVIQDIYTPLMAGASTTIMFPAVTVSAGSNVFAYNVNVDNANSFIELVTGNNASSSSAFYVVPATPFAMIHTEGFESMSLGDETPANAISENPNGIRAYAVDNSVSGSVTWQLGAYEASSVCYRYDYYAIAAGESASIVFEKMDFSTLTGYELRFDHAYAQYQTEQDQLEVFVSTDCGATWTSVFNKAGTQLATAPASSSRFYPQSQHWVTNVVDLSSYDGQSEVMIKFTGTSQFGNSLYLDNIGMYDAITAGVEELLNSNISIYPNPVASTANISIDLKEANVVSVDLHNALGQKVYSKDEGKMSSGAQTVQLDVSELNSGIYFATITIGDLSVTKRINVTK